MAAHSILNVPRAVMGHPFALAAPADPNPQRFRGRVRALLRGCAAALRGRTAAPGTFACSSSIQTVAGESLGARQSLRGDSEPPEPTFGPFGIAERLNWLPWKNRLRNTSSQ